MQVSGTEQRVEDSVGLYEMSGGRLNGLKRNADTSVLLMGI